MTKRLIYTKIKKNYERRTTISLGEAIRISRQKAFHTQEELAHKLNVALSAVNQWELNKVKPNVKA